METTPNDDAQLLRAFAAQQSQSAFRTLVERYQDMVWSTAKRRLGNDQAASDVAQNVFAALARKAPWLSTRSSIGGWLYKSTLMEAARRQRDDLRRYKRERLYSEEMNIRGTNDHDEDAPQFRELMPALDDAMSGLSATDREALVLRFFRGLSLRDTGHALGTTEEAARKRVSRAVDKLSSLFKRRGISIPAAMLAVSVLPKINSATAAPAAFAAKATATAASLPAPGIAATLFMKAAAASKTAVAAACLTATAIPITWQAAKIADLERQNESLSAVVVRPDRARPAAASPVAAAPVSATVSPPSSSDSETSRNASGAQRKEHRGPDWEKLHELERRYDRESRLIAMVEALGLDENQADLIAAAMEKTDSDRKAARDAARISGSAPDKSADTAIKDALHEAIAAVLSPEQQAAYTEFRAAEARDRQEIYAGHMLGEMQRWLHLTAEQKDQLFAVFAEQAAQAGADPSPWVWSKTFEQPGQAQKFQTILKPEQYRLMEERIVTMSNYFRPPAPPPAPAPKPPGAK
jgi:RNA polymerase sigma factor (sigma-70 family)